MKIKTCEIFTKIADEAKSFFKHSPPTHDWSHTQRVVALCEKLGGEEKADQEILLASSFLHDIGRERADREKICHAELSAKLALPILKQVNFPEEKINDVIHCISTHRFRGDNPPQTLEAKILFDADKLDAIGAIGICRAYSYAGENHQPLYTSFDKEYELTKIVDHSQHSPVVEFKVKLSKIINTLYTKSGRRMAEHRHKFMVEFFNEIFEEIKGIK